MKPTNRLSKMVKATSKLPKRHFRSTLWSKAFGRVGSQPIKSSGQN